MTDLVVDGRILSVGRIVAGGVPSTPPVPGSNASAYIVSGRTTTSAISCTFRYDQHWKADGTVLWMMCSTGTIYQHNVSPAWDLTGIAAPASNQSGFTNNRWMYITPDGSKVLFTVRQSGFVSLRSYDLSTNFDITSANNLQFSSTFDTLGGWGQISSDGTRFWSMNGTDTISEYSLGTGFDVTTLNTTAVATFDISAGSPSIAAMDTWAFSATGNKIYTMDANGPLHSWSLSTAYDITTATYDDSGPNLTATFSIPRGMFIRPDTGEIYLEEDQGNFEMAILGTAL